MIGLEYERVFYDHLELKAMIKIYNNLKKELANYKSIKKTGDDNYDSGTKEVIDLLQKILEEK